VWETSIPAHADVVERELDAYGIEAADLVGNSSGGWLALELARRGRARTVTALSPAGMWRGWERHYVFASLRMARAAARVLAPHARRLMQFAPLRLLVWQYFGRPLRLRPLDAAEAIRAMSQAKSFHDLIAWTSRIQPCRLDQINAPVLVAWGGKDRLLFGRGAERFVAAIPRSQLVRLPGVGHVPMQDDPELVAGVIRRFVSGARGE
jgi:pimeloyl-ACP methyl ester carboxylesterase